MRLRDEAVCESCGAVLEARDALRCARCDSLGCYGCLVRSEPACPDCLETALPRHIEPMLATLSTMPADEAGWAFEYKWDGVRALYYWDGARPRIESRNLLDVTFRYPELHDLGRFLGAAGTVLDGEIVALDDRGRPSFPLLQQRMHLSPEKIEPAVRRVPICYYVFDILYAGGLPVMRRPYVDRRALLEGLRLRHPSAIVPPSYPGRGTASLETARRHALEGVVAKRFDSPYEPGRRSPLWRKIKIVQAQEFVIGGWIPERNAPDRIGSLLLGYYGDGLGLTYAGRVGTGFTDRAGADLVEKLRRLERPASPFAGRAPRKDAHWTAPQLVAEVEYRRWPEGGQVQQASFKGLRPDKGPAEVVRERKRRA